MRMLLLLLVATVLGCARSVNSPDYSKMDEETAAIAKTFEQFSHFSKAALAGKGFELHEGLPHPMFNPGLVASEKQSKKTFMIAGYDFYSEPMSVSGSDSDKLIALCSEETNFRPYQGAKACGGFHPDYCMTLYSGDADLYVLFCFGCGEMKSFHGDKQIHCEMSDKGNVSLKKILKGYRKNRPAEIGAYWRD